MTLPRGRGCSSSLKKLFVFSRDSWGCIGSSNDPFCSCWLDSSGVHPLSKAILSRSAKHWRLGLFTFWSLSLQLDSSWSQDEGNFDDSEAVLDLSSEESTWSDALSFSLKHFSRMEKHDSWAAAIDSWTRALVRSTMHIHASSEVSFFISHFDVKDLDDMRPWISIHSFSFSIGSVASKSGISSGCWRFMSLRLLRSLSTNRSTLAVKSRGLISSSTMNTGAKFFRGISAKGNL